MDTKNDGLRRFRVPMYVEAECLGVDERDAADRVAATFYTFNLEDHYLVAELRPGTPLPESEGDPRVFIRQAAHVDAAARNGLIVLRRGERR